MTINGWAGGLCVLKFVTFCLVGAFKKILTWWSKTSKVYTWQQSAGCIQLWVHYGHKWLSRWTLCAALRTHLRHYLPHLLKSNVDSMYMRTICWMKHSTHTKLVGKVGNDCKLDFNILLPGPSLVFGKTLLISLQLHFKGCRKKHNKNLE